jgi:hypothetical protein
MRSAEADIQDNAMAISANRTALVQASSAISDNQARIAESEQAISDNAAAMEGLHTSFAQLDLDVEALASALVHTQERVDENTAGIAVANALAGSTWLQANERFALSGNIGYYGGHTALALSGAARLNPSWSANMAVGLVPHRDEVGAWAGLRWGW